MLVAAGCSPFSSGAFSCQDDDQCDQVGGGVCEATGFCSFPDGSCPSGQRYGDLSGQLSGVCVGEEPVDGVDAGPLVDAGPPSTDWFDNAFATRHRIDIGFTPSGGNLANFPTLVVLDANRVDYGAIQNSGQDLRFVASDNGTVLAHEIEVYDEGGSSYIWVDVPTISTAGGSHFYVYYGNPGASDAQRPADVWDASYRAVWHLSETVTDEATGGVHVDSTGNGNNGDQRNNGPAGDGAGCIGRCQSFDGNDRIEIDQGSLQITGTAITIEARALVRTSVNAYPHVYGAGSDGRIWQIFWYRDMDGWSNRYRVDNTYRHNYTQVGSRNAWATLASVYDGSQVRMLVDGNEVASVAATGDLDTINTQLYIGANPGLSGRELDGYVDELRISNTVRSDDWLSAQHLNQTDALLTITAPEARP